MVVLFTENVSSQVVRVTRFDSDFTPGKGELGLLSRKAQGKRYLLRVYW